MAEMCVGRGSETKVSELQAPQRVGSCPVSPDPLLMVDDTILELMPAAVYVCNGEGRIVRYNRRAAALWGRAPEPGDAAERFSGAHRLFLADGTEIGHAQTPMADVLRTGVPARDIEVRIQQPTGKHLWLLVSIEPIRDGAGRLTGAINCFQDITARKEAEERLRESQGLLRAVVETTPECVKIVAADGRLVHMNRAGLRMIGAGEASAVEGGCAFDLIAAEDRDRWRSCHERVCRGESLSWEFDIVGLDGTRRHMESHAVPFPMPDGTVAQLAVTRDVTSRRKQDDALRERERHFRELLGALPAAVYTTDPEGRITFYNEAAVELWGCRPDGRDIRYCGSAKLFWPDGRPMAHDECPMAVATREDRPLRHAEALAERPDGTRVPFLAYPTPLHDGDGKLVAMVNMLVDITPRKQAEERQRLLVRELNHRVKNTLATVQSIAAQSFRNGAANEAYRWFEGRLIALSTAHDVLTRENWAGAGLRELVAQTVAPHDQAEQGRFEITGEDLRLPPKMALSLAMALHELCTNAAKYGALAADSGRVSVAWQVGRARDGKRLRLRWAEQDGPPVEAPLKKGFGSRLLERGLARELEAEVKLSFPPTGAVCEIDAPVGEGGGPWPESCAPVV